MRIDILSLFPAYFKGPFDESILKKAQEKGLLEINLVNVRDFSQDKFRRVDDRPYGGGPGMVMMPQPLKKAIQSVKKENTKVIYLSPQGNVLTAAKCKELAKLEHSVLLCGHYEGIDQRIIENYVDEEISIGDYVLTNGCLAAIVLVDALVRFIPGVLGHKEAACKDSFEDEGLFDYPHYTKPVDFEGKIVPEVLLSGHHKKITEWRQQAARRKTERVRGPSLSKKNPL